MLKKKKKKNTIITSIELGVGGDNKMFKNTYKRDSYTKPKKRKRKYD
jgi:hypothetical protein